MNHNTSHDMNKRDDIRNCEDGMERQGPTQALPKGYPSFTQGLGLLKSMARVWLEYAYSMARVWLEYAYSMSSVCLKHAYATSMLRRWYAYSMPRACLAYAKSPFRANVQSVTCGRSVRPVRTPSPPASDNSSASPSSLW